VIAPELAGDLLSRALRRGGDLAELYVEERSGLGLTLDDNRVERPQSGRELGASIRVVVGDSTYFGHVDGLAEPDLQRVAESVSQAVSGERREPQALHAAEPAEAHHIGQRPEDVDATKKAELLRACNETARGAGTEVAQVTVGYVQTRRRVAPSALRLQRPARPVAPARPWAVPVLPALIRASRKPGPAFPDGTSPHRTACESTGCRLPTCWLPLENLPSAR